MNLIVRQYCEMKDAVAWDDFCAKSLQATLLHTRRFLSYHGDRFIDRSLIIESDGDYVGLFPAAESPHDSSILISHPGISYGGIVHQGRLRGSYMVEALLSICKFYTSLGYSKLTYKVVPTIYHRTAAQDDLYALFKIGAIRQRCDLSCAISLEHRLPISQRRRRCLKKAMRSDLKILHGKRYISSLWKIVSENLINKYGVIPTHSLNEINNIANLFPENVSCICVAINDEVLAGVLLFSTENTSHAQYITSNSAGNDISALDFLFDHCIKHAHNEGKMWFDFGISNEEQGKYLNNDLYKFKSEFGGGGIVHEFYDIDLISTK